MYRYLRSSLLLFFSVFFVACTSTHHTLPQHRVGELSLLLKSLDSTILLKEATLLSNEIFQEVSKLRQKFNPSSQPWFNNFLINFGVKEKGLCYEWSDALYLHFSKKQYPNFEFHLLVSHKGKYFSEHNTLVVVAKGGKVLEGVVIDPWRDFEKLYFSKVRSDNKYTWEHRSKRGCLR